MTPEEKELLLKDLCARLPYRVKCRHMGLDSQVCTLYPEYISFDKIEYLPYLRPMSSMTEEEREDWYRQSKVDYDCEFKPEPTLSLENCPLSVDWLNARQFDYRGLIPMGLALEAKEGMYKTE